MSHSSHKASLLSLALVTTAALAFGAVGCASTPTAPPVAAAPPSQAFQQAAGGVTAPQGNPEDGVQFVEQEHRDAGDRAAPERVGSSQVLKHR